MKKRSLVATAIVALGVSSASFASGANAPCANSNFDGFYLGAGIGISTHSANWQYTNNRSPLSFDDLSHSKGGNLNLLGRLNLGYGLTFNRLYLGGEGWYQYMPTNRNLIDWAQSVRVGDFDLKNTLGAGARVGFLPCQNLMLYGLLGASTTNFSYNVTDMLRGHHGVDTWTPGITPGAGIEFALNKHISLDARYTYTAYRGITTNLLTADGINDTFKVNPHVSATSISVNFRF